MAERVTPVAAMPPTAPDYSVGIVTFLDILGFQSLVERLRADEMLRILSRFRRSSAPDPDFADKFEMRFTHFSDSVVRTTRVLSAANRQHPVGLVFHELMDLLHMQIELVDEGVFVRGGVTIGNIYDQGEYIFGNALNRAYWLESRVAEHPRIIVDGLVRQRLLEAPELRSAIHDGKTEIDYFDNLVSTSSDGKAFLDYLNAAEGEIGDPFEYCAFLIRHRERIVDGLEAASSVKVRRKFRWLAGYHNSIIDRLDREWFRANSLRPDTMRVQVRGVRPLPCSYVTRSPH